MCERKKERMRERESKRKMDRESLCVSETDNESSDMNIQVDII